ncbi:MAG: CHRD domain-containing protein [Rhodospirillaceae bacterium]|nr:CHRD domain-containing protein [Rhodospirillaceae bacterium]
MPPRRSFRDVIHCLCAALHPQALTAVIAACAFAAASARAEDLGPVRFYADLSADEQSATTISDGIGRVDFALDRDTVRLSWTVTYKNLTSPATAAHIHGPQRPGTNAGVQIDLAPAGLGLPLKGSAVLTDAQLEYLLSGRMYVNVHTTKYAVGELRGQIQRVPPPAPLTN